jgi:putative phosphoribosyl transferase
MDSRPFFQNRIDAGRQLAGKLKKYAGRSDVLVLGLPRGGVVVAYEVAQALNVPMDIFLVRKLGVPMREEMAMGAIASGGVRVINQQVIQAWRLSDETIDAVTEKETRELKRRESLYRQNRPLPDVKGKTVLLIDDGLATGATMQAAVTALRQLHPRWITVAVPVASPETCDAFQDEVDEVICAQTPEPFFAVGLWYAEFEQTTDEEVRELMRLAEHNAIHPKEV